MDFPCKKVELPVFSLGQFVILVVNFTLIFCFQKHTLKRNKARNNRKPFKTNEEDAILVHENREMLLHIRGEG